jgi:hypothetical protein
MKSEKRSSTRGIRTNELRSSLRSWHFSLHLPQPVARARKTSAIIDNVEASNLWAFFQAKTIRMTTLRTAAEALGIEATAEHDPAANAAKEKLIDG